jgi:hypothetical protein
MRQRVLEQVLAGLIIAAIIGVAAVISGVAGGLADIWGRFPLWANALVAFGTCLLVVAALGALALGAMKRRQSGIPAGSPSDGKKAKNLRRELELCRINVRDTHDAYERECRKVAVLLQERQEVDAALVNARREVAALRHTKLAASATGPTGPTGGDLTSTAGVLGSTGKEGLEPTASQIQDRVVRNKQDAFVDMVGRIIGTPAERTKAKQQIIEERRAAGSQHTVAAVGGTHVTCTCGRTFDRTHGDTKRPEPLLPHPRSNGG